MMIPEVADAVIQDRMHEASKARLQREAQRRDATPRDVPSTPSRALSFLPPLTRGLLARLS